MFHPKFTISNKILKNIGIIEACREVVINSPLVPAWEAKFREEALIRTVHHGTHLEGNELNISEAARIMEGREIVARQRDIQEVINYRNVLKFIEEIQDEEIQDQELGMTEKMIKYLHLRTVEKILPREQCGAFRTSQVVVKNSQTGEVTFSPPPAIEVPYQIENFVNWLNSQEVADLHPVLKAGIAHYELVRVHPFLDGNGRVARALALLILFKEGYDVKRFFSLEEYYDKEAARYYGVLQAVGRDGDLTAWLEYFTEGLAIELTRIKEKVKNLSADLRLKEKIGGQVSINEREMKIIEYIQEVGFLQNKQFSQLFPMVSEDTVLRELKSLVEKGIIKKRGVTKAARYVLA